MYPSKHGLSTLSNTTPRWTALALALATLQVSAWCAEKPAAPEWAPQLPWMALNVSYATLAAEKGEGKKVYARNAEGEFLSCVEYQERWFGMDAPIKTEYLVLFQKDTIHQLTLYFEPKPQREALIKRISQYLGEPEQGPCEPGAPSEYAANWISDGVRYDLQDYGDYAEMYVSVARVQSPEAYKLSDDAIVFQRRFASCWSKTRQNVYVVGLRGNERAPLLEQIALVVEVKDKDGVSAPLPAPVSRGFNPQLATSDIDGDGFQDAIVTVRSTEDGNAIQAAVFSFAKRKPTLLFDSSANSLPKITGELEKGYSAVLHVDGYAEAVRVDVKPRQKPLDDAGVYKNGELSAPASIQKTWLSRVEPGETSSGSPAALKCTQEAVFADGTGPLVTIELTLKRTNSQWTVVACAASCN